MNTEELQSDLLKAIQNFELEYKSELDKSSADQKTLDLLYNLGASVKHTFDSFEEAIVKHLKEK